MIELIPPYFLQGTIDPIPGVTPYSALELEGRDLYIREGCNNCHSQMIRPFKTETDRYGHFTMPGEGIYDRPFLYGSRRTGPDLSRVGGKYPDSWHWIHLRNPREIEPRSNMPPYAFLLEDELDLSLARRKLEVLRELGHPYSDEAIRDAAAERARPGGWRGDRAATRRAIADATSQARSEAIALIAYLQRLGNGPSRRSRRRSRERGGTMSVEWIAIYKLARLGFFAIALIGIAIWAFGRSRKERLEEPARRMLRRGRRMSAEAPEIAERPRADEPLRDGIGEEDNADPRLVVVVVVRDDRVRRVLPALLHAERLVADERVRGAGRARRRRSPRARPLRRRIRSAATPPRSPRASRSSPRSAPRVTSRTRSGLVGPSLVDPYWKYGHSDADLFATVAKGRPGGMPAWETQLGSRQDLEGARLSRDAAEVGSTGCRRARRRRARRGGAALRPAHPRQAADRCWQRVPSRASSAACARGRTGC